MLQEAFQNKWLDPSEFNSKEQFFKAYTEAHGKATAYVEIYDLLASAEQRAQQTSNQINNPKRDFSLGTSEDE